MMPFRQATKAENLFGEDEMDVVGFHSFQVNLLTEIQRTCVLYIKRGDRLE